MTLETQLLFTVLCVDQGKPQIYILSKTTTKNWLMKDDINFRSIIVVYMGMLNRTKIQEVTKKQQAGAEL